MVYFDDAVIKKEIIKIGRAMAEKNMIAANDGNISCRVSENAVWTTPTGVSKGELSEDMLVKVDFSQNILDGAFRPSSELKMHLRIYLERPELQAVCHAHPPAATAFALARLPLDAAVYPEALVNLGVVPVAPYATPGSQAVPDSIAPYVRDYNAVLLANHGALTWGRDLTEAWFRLDALEQYARILMMAQSLPGGAKRLNEGEVDAVLALRGALGVTTGGRPTPEPVRAEREG